MPGASCPHISLGHGRWVLRQDRGYYDWSTGWLMRARYNCQGDHRYPPAAAWAHLPGRSNQSWNDLVHAHGGHLRVATAARERASSCGSTRQVVNVLMLGNSYIRQVFEAFANRFRDSVTAGLVDVVSPSILALNQRKGVSIRDFRFWSLPTNGSKIQRGCHGFNVSSYYKQGPPMNSMDRCEDNLAWLEVNRTLRIHFIFRPWAFTDSLESLLRGFSGIGLNDVDVLVCNDRCGGLGMSETHDVFVGACAASVPRLMVDFTPVRGVLQSQLRRDAHTQYGATNAWRKEDSHPCMPGLPDDELDILFAAIATRSCTFTV